MRRFLPLPLKQTGTGLLLIADTDQRFGRHDTFAAEADRVLAKLGTSVFGRLSADIIQGRATVLDKEPELADQQLCSLADELAAGIKSARALSRRRLRRWRTPSN